MSTKGSKVVFGVLRRWPIDTLEKALATRAAIELLHMKSGGGQAASTTAAVKYMLGEYPELIKATHECMAEILLCQRESVTRTGILSRAKQEALVA